MRAHLLVAVLAMGCGETQLGPFQPLPIDTRFEIDGNDDRIHIARDRFGVSHVYAASVRDLGFGQGYVMAHDRLAQMDLLRRFASGTLAELYGAADPSTIEVDRQMRFHRLRRFAVDVWGQLQIRATTRDAQVADLLERFADGVNAYVADRAAGRWPLDPAIAAGGLAPVFAPEDFAPWTPVDSIAILRLFTFAQSWTVPEELDLAALEPPLRTTFGAALARDLLAIAPIPPPGTPPPMPPAGTPGAPPRPAVPPALLATARAFFAAGLSADPARPRSPAAFLRPLAGSTAFVLGSDFTGQQLETATAILAADLQLAPMNPGAFYPMHQIIPGALPDDAHVHDVLGLMLPGVPVAIAGTNGAVGWAPTLGTHDVGDVYLEQLVTVGAQLHSIHGGVQEPVETFDEEIRSSDGSVVIQTYHLVPRHGPIVPVPGGLADGPALAVRYTGYAPTQELAVLWELGDLARDVATAASVLRELRHGPHHMLVDARGAYAWTSFADVPARDPAARAWSPASPDAAAPFFVLDGTDPLHEWGEAPTPLDDLPFRSGLEPAIVIADDDPTGATADGDPLDAYAGVAYANGLRAARIRARLAAATRPVDAADVLAIQHDSVSTFGERLRPELVRLLDEALPGQPAPAQADLALARDALDQWSLATSGSALDSGATLLFNTWMHHFTVALLADELAAAPVALGDDRVARIVHRVLLAPATMAQHPTTAEPLVCGASGCRALVVQAMLDAVAELAAAPSRDWPARHALVLRPLFADPCGTFLLPASADPCATPPPAGFPAPGDMFAVDRTDAGWDDTDFTPRTAAAYRMQLIGSPIGAALAMRLELPTGTVLDLRDPHYRDLLETSYLARMPFLVPFRIDDINAAGESRWEFR